jgi:hypothetical protein
MSARTNKEGTPPSKSKGPIPSPYYKKGKRRKDTHITKVSETTESPIAYRCFAQDSLSAAHKSKLKRTNTHNTVRLYGLSLALHPPAFPLLFLQDVLLRS